MNVAALVFGAYIFRIESCSWKILMSMKCLSLSFLIILVWKSISLDIRMGTSGCFFGPLRQCLSFSLRWVSCQQQNVGSCLCSQSISVCLFIGDSSPLMLRDIKESNCCFLLFLLLKLGFCSCGFLLLGLLNDYFLAFNRAQILYLCWCFPLLSSEGLDPWIDIV